MSEANTRSDESGDAFDLFGEDMEVLWDAEIDAEHDHVSEAEKSEPVESEPDDRDDRNSFGWGSERDESAGADALTDAVHKPRTARAERTSAPSHKTQWVTLKVTLSAEEYKAFLSLMRAARIESEGGFVRHKLGLRSSEGRTRTRPRKAGRPAPWRVVQSRVTADERKLLERRMRRAGVGSMSSFVRGVLGFTVKIGKRAGEAPEPAMMTDASAIGDVAEGAAAGGETVLFDMPAVRVTTQVPAADGAENLLDLAPGEAIETAATTGAGSAADEVPSDAQKSGEIEVDMMPLLDFKDDAT